MPYINVSTSAKVNDKQILDGNKILDHYSHQAFFFDNYLKLPMKLIYNQHLKSSKKKF